MDLYPANSINTGFLTDLQKVSGMSGARAVLTRANSRMAVFDDSDDLFYIISTDINNNKTIVRYRFYEEPEPKPEDVFASKEEIKELKGEIENVQQSIRDLTNAITSSLNNSSNAQSYSGSNNYAKKHVQRPNGDSRSNEYAQKPNESESNS